MTARIDDAGRTQPEVGIGTGPGAYADRADHPDLTAHGDPKIVPLRAAPGFYLESRDPDPHGMEVVGADDVVAGTVSEVWVDRAEPQLRYLEVALSGRAGSNVLLPIGYCRFAPSQRRVKVKALLAHQFAGAPRIARPDIVTLLEEDKIMAYFASGHLYATPERFGPVL